MKSYDQEVTCSKIFELAKKKGWTDSKLAKVIELTPQAVSKWHRGGGPSIDNIVMLSDLFQISLDDLVGYRENDLSFQLEDGR